MLDVDILTIGDEICRGEIVDTNSAWLAAQLWDLGVTPAGMSSCTDDPERMREAILAASARSEIVLVSGGLGPTVDDRTVDVVAGLANSTAVVDEAALGRIEALFRSRGRELSPHTSRQARVPAGARVLTNSAGLAPGFTAKVGRAEVTCMPGVPRELQAIFAEHVLPVLERRLAREGPVARRKLRVFGLGESHVAEALEGLELGEGGAVHYQVHYPETFVKLVVAGRVGESREDVEARATDVALRAKQCIGEAVYGEGEDDLPICVGRALEAAGATLAVAESCTGGLLGALITEVPGSSAYFTCGYVTYSNEAKERELGVEARTLEEHGAVSTETAMAMALGARARSGAGYACAVTGVAGPGGGSDEKPVGTVCIAVVGPAGISEKRYTFPGSREQIRRLSAHWALQMVLRALRSEAPGGENA